MVDTIIHGEVREVKTRRKRFGARNAEIAELWDTGEYSLNVLAAMFGLGRNYINCILRRSGDAKSRKVHRDYQIVAYHSEGRSDEWLSERFKLSQNRLRQIIRALQDKEPINCSVCGGGFVPRTHKSFQCSPKCANIAWEISNVKHAIICPVCREGSTSHTERGTCSRRCAHILGGYRKVDRNIEIRRLDIAKVPRREIAQKYGLSLGQTQRICQNASTQARVCVAVIALRRHKGKVWLSQGAQLERRRARHTLADLGLWNLYRSGRS